jgi:predicted branched-subunit amino acid permease
VTALAPAPAGRIDRDALCDAWPVLLGIAPFGLLIGVTIAHTGLGAALGLGSAAAMFGGGAHFAALTLLANGAGPAGVLGAVVVINARLALYAAALQPRFRDQPAWFRWLAPHLLVDQTYALTTARPELDDPARFRRYWLTAGAAFAIVWLGSHVVGLLLADMLPDHSPLDIAAPALFVGLLMPQLRRAEPIVAATVGAGVAAAASPLPQGAGLILGALAGIAAAALTDRHGSEPGSGTSDTDPDPTGPHTTQANSEE